MKVFYRKIHVLKEEFDIISEKVGVKTVPAAAVIQCPQALTGIIGCKKRKG